MPTFTSSYLVSSVGYNGRVAFSSTSVAYFFPLIDSALTSIDNSVSGSTANYNPPADIQFPVLFQFTASAACRVRQRVVHPSVGVGNNTADMFTRMISGGGGYTNVAAATDLIRNATLPSASVAAGTASAATRIFNVIRAGSYGSYVPAGVTFPIMVTSMRDCWLQIVARDSAGTGTTGELVFTCVSTNDIIGY